MPLHTPGHTAGMISLLVNGTDVFTGDTLFQGSVGGVRAPGHTTYADLKSLDHGHAADAARRRPGSIPATPSRRRSPRSSSTTGSCASGAGSIPEGSEPCTAMGEPATLILLGDDYDGGHKAWVRWPDGARRHRPGLPGANRPESLESAPWPSDKIPTSRVGRTAKVGRLAAGQAIRQAGTRAANVTRSPEGRKAALEKRHIEAAEQIVTALGTMKGAAMKVGQVMSFLDVGLVPEEYREEFQKKLAALRDAAPTVTFKQMRAVIEDELGGTLTRDVRRVRRGADRGGVDRPGVPRAGCTTTARWRSRSSTPASPPRSAPTCRTSA